VRDCEKGLQVALLFSGEGKSAPFPSPLFSSVPWVFLDDFASSVAEPVAFFLSFPLANIELGPGGSRPRHFAKIRH